MTPDERDRLTALEIEQRGMKEWLKSIDEKVDQLVGVANMGRGAWFLLLKIGGVVAAVAAVSAWIYDKIPHK